MAAHSSLYTFSILQIAGDGEGVNPHVSFVAENLPQGIISQTSRQAARSGSRAVHLPEGDFWPGHVWRAACSYLWKGDSPPGV
jgi:hypothetical protein